MLYIISILLLILIFLISYLIHLNINKKEYDMEKMGLNILEQISEKTSSSKEDILKFLYENKESINNNLNHFSNKLKDDNINFKEVIKENVNKDVSLLGDKVEKRLFDGFKNTKETFERVIERLAKIDEAQKNIEKLSNEIVGLQKILSDKKSRGTFGEMQLEQILEYVYGDSKLYERQYTLPNNKKVDAIIKLNNDDRILSIDSKFPLENYLKFIESNDKETRKSFVDDVKKHIDDIAEKYIIEGKTLNQAILFLPSESIFLDIHSNFEEVIEYSYKKRVWICSKINLMIYITTIQITSLEYKRSQNAKQILKNLIYFSNQFRLYKERWEKLEKDFEKVGNDLNKISITTKNISNKFEEIVKMEEVE